MFLPKAQISDREIVASGNFVLGPKDDRLDVAIPKAGRYIFTLSYGDSPLSVTSDAASGATEIRIEGIIPLHFGFNIETVLDNSDVVRTAVMIRSQLESAGSFRTLAYTSSVLSKAVNDE